MIECIAIAAFIAAVAYAAGQRDMIRIILRRGAGQDDED